MNIATKRSSFWVGLSLFLLLMVGVSTSFAQPDSRVAKASKDTKSKSTSKIKQPRGTDVLWDKVWRLKNCKRKNIKSCVTPSRYTSPTSKQKKDRSWKKAIRTTRFLVSSKKKRAKAGTFVPFKADGVRYAAYIVPKDEQSALKKSDFEQPIRGTILFIRKIQDKVRSQSASSKKTLKNKPFDPVKRPRGVHVYWKWVWNKEECERKKRKQCVPPKRYRPVTPEDKRHPSWQKAVLTARYVLSGVPAYGSFIPFKTGGIRYVAYVSPHSATDIDTNGDGKLERVPLDEPVRGVSVYIRKVQ